MAKPEIDIEVDEATGRWSVDALPMILVPQHFFLNNHFAVEAALGAERLEAVLRPAGHRSAFHWCEKEAAFHGLDGVAAFHHYMRRITQRGWGRFDVLALDLDAGTASVRLANSAMVDAERRERKSKACSMFAAWLEGSLDYASQAEKRPARFSAREVYCEAEGAHDHCLFQVTHAQT
jgi:hypothetical protein